ncbi:MAG TPA: sensor histidine kinase, partial [Jatrophihabitans sp.]|nr:sensor histidine kinase [Jatrophihabitans sp.]
VQSCVEHPSRGCAALVQARATKVQFETNAAYVVVIDMNRVRHSHPDPTLIGQQVEEPIVTLDGQTHAGIDHGATGRSANGKAPMYSADGAMIGEVSVGIKESAVSVALWNELPAYAGWFAVALGAGAVASWLLARRLKRKTFGLELDEIAQLLQEREATLHGIREGIVAFDQPGRVTMVNDEARRLLKIGKAPVGGRLDDLVPPGRLREVLAGRLGGGDEIVLTDDYALVVNRMPVMLAGRPHGAVVTLRDRTEMSGLLRELDGVRSLTDSLRAQQHEFTNRMHTLAGLLELGQYDDALGYVTEMQGSATEFADSVRSQVAAPLIVGLLLGKAAVASERGISLEISEDTWLGDALTRPQALTTIVGNLIDNAFEAVSPAPGSGRVTVAIVEDEDSICVRVADNGPGIPDGMAEQIFADGYTTKEARGSLHRGLGLALVHRLVLRLNGTITVSEGPGAEFTVVLPKSILTAPLSGVVHAAERAAQ